MKKSFQIIREIEIKGGESVTLIEQLKEAYAKCTGVFCTPFSAETKFDKLSCSLKIAGIEILPANTDLMLFAFNGNTSLNDTTYDFSRENIPSRSSDVELIVKNNSESAEKINFYFVLEN